MRRMIHAQSGVTSMMIIKSRMNQRWYGNSARKNN